MRKLVITRGAPGSGKSTLLQESGLGPFALSTDAVRLVLGAPTLDRNGRFKLSQELNDRAWTLLRTFAEERMRRGELLAIDVTAQEIRDLKPFLKLAQMNRYRVLVADLSGVPLPESLENNRRRESYRIVPDFAIERAYEFLAATPTVEDGFDLVRWRPDGGHVAVVRRWLAEPVLDFSCYSAVVHIGDLQGCFTVLTGKDGPLAGGFRDDVRYVFVGDLLDRGDENGNLLKWFVEEALPRGNVDLLWGNHEDHLHAWARGLPIRSGEFRHSTLPQLEAAGVSAEDAERVCADALEALAYSYGENRVLVTHAGLSTVPERLEEISLRQFSHGTGYWEDPVDQQFDRHAPEGWWQVHGHRNHGWKRVRASERSFNLEGRVEDGGHLRTATLSGCGWETAEYRNKVFRPYRKRRHGMDDAPAWLKDRDGSGVFMEKDVLAAMREHVGVRERTSSTHPHVSSLNFTRKVFRDGAWDDVVLKARGFFFNNITREVVARGDEKFFNVGQLPETTWESLSRTLSFPVTAYVKENGYLGALGYDSETDELFYSSKSSPDTDFALWFKEIFETKVDEGRRDAIRRYLRSAEACMVFEVNDPVRDPHVIEYGEAHVVLLNVFRRSVEKRKLPYDELCALGRKFGLTVKQKAMVFKDWKALGGWLRAVDGNMDYKISRRHVEGVVLEDASGTQVKEKFAWYSFWKRMRSLKERIRTRRAKGLPFDRQVQDPLAVAFRDWCLDQDSAVLEQDIITLRKSFEKSGSIREEGCDLCERAS